MSQDFIQGSAAILIKPVFKDFNKTIRKELNDVLPTETRKASKEITDILGRSGTEAGREFSENAGESIRRDRKVKKATQKAGEDANEEMGRKGRKGGEEYVEEAAEKIGGGRRSLLRAVSRATGSLDNHFRSAGTRGGNSFVSGLKGALMGVGAMIAGLGIGRALTASITEASNVEQGRGAVQAVYKSSANQALQNAGNAANTYGLSEAQYLELATTLGGQGKNLLGIAESNLATWADEQIAWAADLAAQYGGTTAEAVEAIGSMFRGEYNPIERYNVTVNATMADEKAKAEGLTRSQAVLALAYEQSADAQGAASREFETYASQLGRVQANVADLKAELGEMLMPTVLRLSTWMLEEGVPKLREFAGTVRDEVIPKLREWGKTFRDELQPYLVAFTDWWKEDGRPAFKHFKAMIDDNKDALIDLAPKLLGVVASLRAIHGLFELIRRNPLAATLIATAGAFAYLYMNSEDFRKTVDEVVPEMIKTFNEMWNVLKPILDDILAWVKDNPDLVANIILFGGGFLLFGRVLLGVGRTVKAILSPFAKFFKMFKEGGRFASIGTTLSNAFKKIGGAIKGAFSGIGKFIGNALTAVGRLVGNFAKSFGGMIGRFFSTAFSSVGRIIGSFGKNVGGWLMNALRNIPRLLGFGLKGAMKFIPIVGWILLAVDLFRIFFPEQWAAFTTWLGEKWTALTTWFSTGWGNFWSTEGLGGKAQTFLTETVPGYFDSLRNWIGEKWTGFTEWLGSAWSTFWNGLADPVRGALDVVRSVWEDIKSAFATPINWVLEHVWNNGFVAAYNAIARVIGRPELAPASLIDTSTPRRMNGSAGGRAAHTARKTGGYTPAGLTLVGEEGPEYLQLDRPSRVYNAAQTRRMGYHGSGADDAPKIPLGSRSPTWEAAQHADNWVRGQFANLTGAVLDPLFQAIQSTRAMQSPLGQFAGGAASSIKDKFLEWVRGQDQMKVFSGPVSKAGDPGARSIPGAVDYVNRAGWALADEVGGIRMLQTLNKSMAGGHRTGKAIDFWDAIPKLNALSDAITRTGGFGNLKYMAWQGQLWSPDSGWRAQGRGYGNDPQHRRHLHAEWYDNGGWLMPGMTATMNGTGQPEAVFTNSQWQSISTLAERGASGSFPDTVTLVDADGSILTKARVIAVQTTEQAFANEARW